MDPEEILKKFIIDHCLDEPEIAIGQCYQRSYELRSLVGRGRLILGYGYRGAIAKDAASFYKEKVRWAGHVALLVGNVVLDPTASQFGCRYPGIIYDFSLFEELWRHVVYDEIPHYVHTSRDLVRMVGMLEHYEIEG